MVIFGLRHLRPIYDLAAMACLVKGKGAPFAHMADAFHLKHIDPRHNVCIFSTLLQILRALFSEKREQCKKQSSGPEAQKRRKNYYVTYKYL